ncbi:MAG: carboxypeptidase-like regulatory domain-containing protein [Candidatus Sumerlaeota bacterium]|nr:carboxypeptidase-like regulatory domain-containing protein [Candidatus Sumerlaeota bacterium]
MNESALIANYVAPSQHRAILAKLSLAAVFIAVAAGSAYRFQVNSGKPPEQDQSLAQPLSGKAANATVALALDIKGPVIKAAAVNAPETKPSQAPAISMAPQPPAPPPLAPQPQVLLPAKSVGAGGVGSLSGRVLIGQSPAASVKVVLYPQNKDDKSALQMTTKNDGQYAFNGLKEGAYTIHVEMAADKGFSMLEESLEIKGPMRHDVTLPDKSQAAMNLGMNAGQFTDKGPRVHFQFPGGDRRGLKNPSSQAPMAAPGKPAKSEPPEGF